MTKNGYRVFFTVVVLLNTAACLAVTIVRNEAVQDFCQRRATVKFVLLAVLEQVCNLFLVFDAIILTFAIFRIKRELAQTRSYTENKETMFLSVNIDIGHSII